MKSSQTRQLAVLLSRLIEEGLPRRFWIWLIQVAIFAVSGVAAFLLRFDFAVPRIELRHLAFAVLVWMGAKSLAFRLLNLYHGWWRYVSIPDVLRITIANVIGSVIGAAGILLLAPSGFPRSIYVLDFVLCAAGTSGIRVLARMLAEAAAQVRQADPCKRVLIYGAGAAGQMLLREIRSNSGLRYDVQGFIDDDPNKRNASLHGVRRLGAGPDLVSLVKKRSIAEILVAIPSASGPEMVAILGQCQAAGVPCKTIPGLAELVERTGLATQIRDVAVEDLLGRTPARLEQEQIAAKLTGNTVLVTGAAGSIGSELCRQIARFHPRAIVGFEIAESALFHLEREMRLTFPDVRFHSEIGSIQNKQRLTEVFQQHRPSIIYHAAAYKHVPMMEAHVFEAIENNVFGTWNVATAAAKHGVEDFVMISSDKAVRPTNIMGATKRVAELLIMALPNGRTNFVSVRFGNVLGSNGSVIPIFKQQIAAGGPVTVTHPEMRRYFMTIPEASQLVIQASTMGGGGEIFVLDMCEPVRIVDLARNLILLSGLRPDEDIKIEYTGVRPGEKLYEELNSLDEEVLPTRHEKIKIFAGNGLPAAAMRTGIEELREVCARRDLSGLVLTLKELVPDYNPSSHILQRALTGSPVPREHAAVAR